MLYAPCPMLPATDWLENFLIKEELMMDINVTLNEIDESIGSERSYGIEFDRHGNVSDSFISCQKSDGTLVKGVVVSNAHNTNPNPPSLETQFIRRSKFVTSKILQTTTIGQNNTVNFRCTVEQGEDEGQDIQFWIIKFYWVTTTSLE